MHLKHSNGAGKASKQGSKPMFLTIAAGLFILWLLGFAVFPIAGGLIHIVLVIAVIMVIVHFVRGRTM